MLDRLSKKKRNIGLLVVLALIGWFFWTIRSVLNPLILGYLLAFVLHPAVLHLERKRGWTRPRAVNVIFLAAALFITITVGGIYLQGKQLVESVAAADGKDDVLLRAEHEIDAFLVKARTWSDRFTGGSKSGSADDGEDREDQDAEGPAPIEERGADGGDAEAHDRVTTPPVDEPPAVEAPAQTTESGGAPPGATEPGATQAETTASEVVSSDPEPPAELTLRDIVQAWWKGYVARTEGGVGAVALQNVPAVIVVLVNFFGSIVSLVALVLLLPIYGYFLLFELERIHRFVRRHIPKDERERVTRIGTQIGGVIANFFRGRLMICVLKGSVITIGLALAGAPYALFFGVMAGAMSLVPFVGPMLTFVCAMVFGLQELSLVSALLWIGGTFLLGEILEGYVFIPKILGDSLGLHPVVVLVSIFAGGAALGMFGFLIAIPLMATFVILARELLLPALRQFADEDTHTDPPTRAPFEVALAVGASAGSRPEAGPTAGPTGGSQVGPGTGSGRGSDTGPDMGPGATAPGARPAPRRRK